MRILSYISAEIITEDLPDKMYLHMYIYDADIQEMQSEIITIKDIAELFQFLDFNDVLTPSKAIHGVISIHDKNTYKGNEMYLVINGDTKYSLLKTIWLCLPASSSSMTMVELQKRENSMAETFWMQWEKSMPEASKADLDCILNGILNDAQERYSCVKPLFYFKQALCLYRYSHWTCHMSRQYFLSNGDITWEFDDFSHFYRANGKPDDDGLSRLIAYVNHPDHYLYDVDTGLVGDFFSLRENRVLSYLVSLEWFDDLEVVQEILALTM